MNDNIGTTITHPTLDNDQIDALMAKLYAEDVLAGNVSADTNPDGSDREDAQPEGAFVAEDSTSKQLN